MTAGAGARCTTPASAMHSPRPMVPVLGGLFALVQLQLGQAAAAPTCSDGEPGDQHGGQVVHGLSPHFINKSTATLCCFFCFAPTAAPDSGPRSAAALAAAAAGAKNDQQQINAWVWQPSTTHCWCVAGARGKVLARADRRVGGPAVTPPPPIPGPSSPPMVAVEPWGADSLRVRIFYGGSPRDDLPGALLPLPRTLRHTSRLQGAWGTSSTKTVNSGNIQARLTPSGVQVSRVAGDQAELWSTESLDVFGATGAPHGSGYLRWVLSVGSCRGERIWGLGERTREEPMLNNKGLVIDFHADQHNTKITMPWMVSSRRAGTILLLE
jgi:hypothetical protein